MEDCGSPDSSSGLENKVELDENDSKLLRGLVFSWIGILVLTALLCYFTILFSIRGPTWLAFLLLVFGLPAVWSLLRSFFRKTADLAVEFEKKYPLEEKEAEKIDRNLKEKLKNILRVLGSAFVATDEWIQRWRAIGRDLDLEEIRKLSTLVFIWAFIFGCVICSVFGIFDVLIDDGPVLFAVGYFVLLRLMFFGAKLFYTETGIFIRALKQKAD